jgi:hypothetical protein
MEGPMATAALVIVGIVLVFIGIFAAERLEWVALGVLALIAAGVLQLFMSRRA